MLLREIFLVNSSLSNSSKILPSITVQLRYMLFSVVNIPQLLIAGSTQFNSKPSKGIAFLQEQGLLTDSKSEIAAFLHENHLLDKGMLGDYLGDRKNSEILDEFIKFGYY